MTVAVSGKHGRKGHGRCSPLLSEPQAHGLAAEYWDVDRKMRSAPLTVDQPTAPLEHHTFCDKDHFSLDAFMREHITYKWIVFVSSFLSSNCRRIISSRLPRAWTGRRSLATAIMFCASILIHSRCCFHSASNCEEAVGGGASSESSNLE